MIEFQLFILKKNIFSYKLLMIKNIYFF